MELSRKQLNTLIENYLFEQQLKNQTPTYTVKGDETLTQIAEDIFNLGTINNRGPVQQLVWVNDLKTEDLSKGQKLTIPGIRVYKVQKGDVLSIIAEKKMKLSTRDGKTPSQLVRDANDLGTAANEKPIFPGQILLIPKIGKTTERQKEQIQYYTGEKDDGFSLTDTLSGIFGGDDEKQGEEDLSALKKKPVQTSFDFVGPHLMPLEDISSHPIVSNSSPNRYLKSRGYAQRHEGIDISAPLGTPVYATGTGKITVGDSGSKGYGKYVIITHNDGYKTLYGHLNKILKSKGQLDDVSEPIGTVGNTGAGTGVHLHYEIRKQGVPRDVDNTSLEAPWRLTHEWVKKNIGAFTFKGDKKAEFDEIESKIQSGEIDKIESGER